ncbi:MAG TPA: hypothetical protein VMY42_15605 [Thermoguttaceae bacterium]|nr:hypothetical protein [Thermoguttaceae bacterium]
MLSDTHPEAEKVQIELIRQMSVGRRMAIMQSMTAMAIKLSRRAIARANPELSPREVDLKWVELHYGKELAGGFREWLSQR